MLFIASCNEQVFSPNLPPPKKKSGAEKRFREKTSHFFKKKTKPAHFNSEKNMISGSLKPCFSEA